MLFDDTVQVVSIDEGQFVIFHFRRNFSILNFQFEDLAATCEELAGRGKIVCVALLSGTFERKVGIFSFLAKILIF